MDARPAGSTDHLDEWCVPLQDNGVDAARRELCESRLAPAGDPCVRRQHVGREQLEPRVDELELPWRDPLEPRRPRLLRVHPATGRALAEGLAEIGWRIAEQALAPGERVGRSPPGERDDDERAEGDRD